MSGIEFEAWPKIPRLNRGMVVTEKIDGTNAAVVVIPVSEVDRITHENGSIEFFDNDAKHILYNVAVDGEQMIVAAQSRTRLLTLENDNYGFAGWVKRNAAALARALGPGRHFGEWWGSGIQRGYALTGGDKRFSLFNTSRWTQTELDAFGVPGLGVVPLLYIGQFDHEVINNQVNDLRAYGSIASHGYERPEGVVVYLPAARSMFKVMVENDDIPKGE